jgi:glycosyltransferase involved in cell wall biosynthesis
MTASAGSQRLKVLFFSQRFPFPMDTGGKIRTGKILEQLKNVFDITLVSNVESPKDDKYLDQIKGLCAEFHPVPWKEVKKYSFRFYLKLFLAMFCRYPFTVISDYSKDLETALLDLTTSNRFDLLVCDFLQPSLNMRKINGVPKLLFQHNIESVIPRRHFETSRNPIARVFWWVQWHRMERYERETCMKFAGMVTVSEKDKKAIQNYGIENVFAIPTGVDTDYFIPREDLVAKNSLVFTGSMDWLPNEDAIIFFAQEILGKIKENIPDIKLTVVGRNPSRRLLKEVKSHPEIKVVGWVEDVRRYISSHSLYVIPLRIGGGTRIKAYEAMAMGKAVVSTRVGVEGLPVQHGDQLIIADQPADFAAAVIKLLADSEQRKRIERNARSFVEAHFGWAKVAEVFAGICRETVGARSEDKMAVVGKAGNVKPLQGLVCESRVSGQ